MKSDMKAFQVIQSHQLVMKDIPIPEIGKNQALVSLKYGMLCGSDYPQYADEWIGFSPPLPPGMPLHECVGQITESRIPNLLPNTWVLAMPENDCGLSEYFLVSYESVTPLIGWVSADLPYATLGQPASTVLYSLHRLGSVFNQTVLIFGLGGIGFIFCALLYKMGVKQIIAIEPNEFRRNLVSNLFDVKVFADWSDELENIADISVDAAGQKNQNEIISACITSTRPYGRIVLFGVPTISEQNLSVYSIIRKNLTMIGTINPNWLTYLPLGYQAVKNDLELFKPMVTHKLHWSEAPQAFELFGQPDEKRVKILLHN